MTDQKGPGKLVYGEKTNDVPFINPFTTYFTVEAEGNQSKVTLEGITESNSLLAKLMSPLIKLKLKPTFKTVLADLKSFAEQEAPVN